MFKRKNNVNSSAKEKKNNVITVVLVVLAIIGMLLIADWVEGTFFRPNKVTWFSALFGGVSDKDKISDAKSNFQDWMEEQGLKLSQAAINCAMNTVPDKLWLDAYETKSFYRISDWMKEHLGGASKCF